MSLGICLDNLVGLSALVSERSGKMITSSVHNGTSIFLSEAAWPNYVFSEKTNLLLDDFSLVRLAGEREYDPILVTKYDKAVDDKLRGQGIIPVELWYGMQREVPDGMSIGGESSEVVVTEVADVGALAGWADLVQKELFGGGGGLREVFQSLASVDIVFLQAHIGSVLVGTTMIYINRDKGVAGLYMVCVDSNFRKRNVGSELMRYSLRLAKSHRVSHLVLQSTRMGKRLYDKFGFAEIAKFVLYKEKRKIDE